MIMFPFECLSLSQGFRQNFRIDAALDDARRDAVYRIRHEVYCEELKYEPERPDHREVDEYDTHSVHFLLSTVSDPHISVGCARLVLVNPADPDAPLPFERICAKSLDRSIIDPAKFPRRCIAEVSRLAVRESYRIRKGEHCRAQLAHHEKGRCARALSCFPFIPLGLYLGAISLAAHRELEVLFVLTEPRLANHFARLGVNIRQIGDPVSHRGTRVPSVIDVQSVIRGIHLMIKPLWHTVNEDIESSIPPFSMRH